MAPSTREELDELSDEVRGPEGVYVRLKAVETKLTASESLAADRHNALKEMIRGVENHMSRTEKIFGGVLMFALFIVGAVALGGGRWGPVELGAKNPVPAAHASQPPTVPSLPEPTP